MPAGDLTMEEVNAVIRNVTKTMPVVAALMLVFDIKMNLIRKLKITRIL